MWTSVTAFHVLTPQSFLPDVAEVPTSVVTFGRHHIGKSLREHAYQFHYTGLAK